MREVKRWVCGGSKSWWGASPERGKNGGDVLGCSIMPIEQAVCQLKKINKKKIKNQFKQKTLEQDREVYLYLNTC